MKLKIYAVREQNNPVFSYYVAQDINTAEETFRSERYLSRETPILTDIVGEIDVEEGVLKMLDERMRNQESGLVAFFDNRGMSYMRLKFAPLRKIMKF